jgi:hypothetical protein
MTGRGASEDDEQQDHGRGSGRLLLVAALTLALGAAAVLVLSDNARWLRLAVVAALWAALVGAFLAARYRKQISEREDEVADLQSVYELELEREIAARREYELEVEAETRKRVQDEAKDDLDALRGELRALRENLEALLGGEVLVERVALRAESTRMRALSDQSRLMAVGDKRIINAGPAVPVTKKAAEAPQVERVERTELIERVNVNVDTSRKDQVRRPEPARPEPVRREQAQPVRREAARATAQSRPTPPVVVRREAPQQEPTERVSRDVAARLSQQAAPAGRPAEPSKTEHTVQRRSRVADRTEMISRDALAEDAARRTEGAGGAVRRTGEQRAVPRTESTGEQRSAAADPRRPSAARVEPTGEHRPVEARRPATRAEVTGEHRPVEPGRRPAARVEPTGEQRPVGRPDPARRPVTRAELTGEHVPVAEPAPRAQAEDDARASRRPAGTARWWSRSRSAGVRRIPRRLP